MKATILFSILLAVLFLLIRQSAFAQGAATGDLHVTVKDPKGSAVTNATIAVSNVAKGLERTATSDGQGGYSVRRFSPGTYTVTVNAPGFAKVEATEVVITVGGMVELPVALSVAGGKEVVEVSAQADLVETSRTSSIWVSTLEDNVGEATVTPRCWCQGAESDGATGSNDLARA